MSTQTIELKTDAPSGQSLEQSANSLLKEGVNVSAEVVTANSGTTATIQQPNTKTEFSSGEARPEWLPEKFANAQDLAKAYSELEKKFSGNKEAADTETENLKIEKTDDSTIPAASMDKYSNEYAEKGELSDKSYKELAKQGITKDLVNAYIEGQKALADNHVKQVHDVVGGTDSYNKLVEWATENLSENEISGFNELVETGTIEQIRFGVRGLMAQSGMSVPNQSSELIDGEVNNIDTDSFTSLAQVTSAMNDPRYQNDPSFRQLVTEKIAKSSVF